MGTFVHSLTQQYANDCAALPDYPSSVNSGIAGDSSHYNSNTYHIAVHHLPVPGGYTNSWSKDRVGAPDEQYAVAVDQSMSTADMKKEWARFEAVFYDASDPRRQYIAEYIGWNGVGQPERLDFADGSREVASPDHSWHSHEAGWRQDADNAESYRARLSVRKGETKEQYTGGGQDVDTRQNALLVATAYRVDAIHKDLVEIPTSAETTGVGVAGEDNLSRKARIDMEARLMDQIEDLRQRLVALENKPPVQPTPVDAATLATAMQDPAVDAVMVDAAKRGANLAEDS